MSSAGVNSIDVIRVFRDGLCLFGDDCRAGLTAAEMDAHRASNWLRDRMADWQLQLKRRKQDLSNAQAELFRMKLSSAHSEPPGVTEKKELVRKAQRRVEEAEQKIVAIKKWMPVLQHAIEEYHGRSRGLTDILESGVPHALAMLDRMTEALDAYISLAPPPAPVAAPIPSKETSS